MSQSCPLDMRPEHWEVVKKILQKHVADCEIWAFGSRVTHKSKAFSDLDLVIVKDKRLPVYRLAALEDDFMESDLPWKVDVLEWSKISKTFQDIIMQQKVIIQTAAQD